MPLRHSSQNISSWVAVANFGFQPGGDAGPAGRQGRRSRIETKRYADRLEAWFLMATRAVPEQLELELMRKSDDLGLPIIIVDWKLDAFPALALCTAAPVVLETLVSREAADLARELATEARTSLDSLGRDMEAWNLDFERLRALSVEQLGAIWNDPRTSLATLGQDAAGGAYRSTALRVGVSIGVGGDGLRLGHLEDAAGRRIALPSAAPDQRSGPVRRPFSRSGYGRNAVRASAEG